MGSYQQITILGHLGADPEARQTTGGKTVVSFRLAVSEKRRGKDGEGEEQTEWFRCVAFDRTGEVVRDYTRKGDPLLVVGRLQTREWEDKEGAKRYTTEVLIDRVVLQGRGQGQPERNERSPGSERAPRTPPANQAAPKPAAWGPPAPKPAPPAPPAAPAGDDDWGAWDDPPPARQSLREALKDVPF